MRIKITGAVGIEPTSMVLETTVLPLNYAPVLGFKPTREIIAQRFEVGKKFLYNAKTSGIT